jgi:hypothetical protein
MERKNLVGITRASMRSSKSLKKEFKNSKAIQDMNLNSHSGSVSLFGLSKSILFKGEKSTNTRGIGFKDSVKLKRISLKTQINSKIVSAKHQSQNGNPIRNKENNVNGVSRVQAQFDSESRRPFLNLEKQPLEDITLKFRSSNNKMMRVPFGNLTLSNNEEVEIEQSLKFKKMANDSKQKSQFTSEGLRMEIEVNFGKSGVEQLYGDIMAYIMSKQVIFFKPIRSLNFAIFLECSLFRQEMSP